MKLVEVKESEKEILENLLQQYLDDINQYFPISIDEKTGLYLYDELDKYFDETENHAYFIKKEEETVGFILYDNIGNKNIIQEIFILNQYKNKGIGKIAAYELFNQYKGDWEVKSLPNSESAERFWERIIKEYTKDYYNVEHVGKYNRAVFTFENIGNDYQI